MNARSDRLDGMTETDIRLDESFEKRQKRFRTIEWIPVEESLPDSDMTVLLHAPKSDEPVWPGYYGSVCDGPIGWHYIDHAEAEGVTHWSEMPEGPR